MKLRKSFVKYQHKDNMIKQRNLLKTPSFIKIQLSLVSLSYPKKKKAKNIFKSPSIFVFITMAYTTQNSSKKKNLQRNLQIINSNTI